MQTLFTQLVGIERMVEQTKELNYSPPLDVYELHQSLFQKYNDNQVLQDALKGRKSVQESLSELGQINKGIRKLLPWRKNQEHNERLGHLGALVTKPDHLQTRGVFWPDNMVSAGVETAAFTFGVGYMIATVLAPYIPTQDSGVSSPETTQFLTIVVPTLVSGVFALIGVLSTTIDRLNPLPKGQAEYLDKKIQEYYR